MTEKQEPNEKQLRAKINSLERKLFELQAVLKEYREKFGQPNPKQDDSKEYYEEIEKHNSLLISFSVAVQQLHSTFDYARVINTVKEICTNLIGAKEYGLYIMDSAADKIVLVTHDGFQKDSQARHEKLVRSVIESGEIWIADADTPDTDQEIKTCVPLRFDQEVFGVLVIATLLEHKKLLDDQDLEILRLLGKHAAMAIYSAKLYWIAKIEHKLNIRKEIIDLLPPSASLSKDYFFPSKK